MKEQSSLVRSQLCSKGWPPKLSCIAKVAIARKLLHPYSLVTDGTRLLPWLRMSLTIMTVAPPEKYVYDCLFSIYFTLSHVCHEFLLIYPSSRVSKNYSIENLLLDIKMSFTYISLLELFCKC